MSPRQTPLIIWTLQRTGGTNLTQRLVERVGLPVTEHEPFNGDRAYGDVTLRWKADRDVAALASRMREICSRPSIIKHCVEMVSWEITQALAEASSEAGFRHLFLYRKQPASRLLSLQFARRSGIWGPQGKTAKVLDQIYAEPLPVSELVAHEVRCTKRLQDTWEKLISLGQNPVALAFEDVYVNDSPDGAKAKVEGLLAALGLHDDPAFVASFITDVLNKGNQGTRNDYARFQGLGQLERSLRKVTPFIPAPELTRWEVTRPDAAGAWIRYAALDAAGELRPKGAALGLAGLAVTTPQAPKGVQLVLCQGKRETSVPWGFASQWAKQKFPKSPNADRARFALKGVCLDGDMELVLVDPVTGSRQTVLNIHGASPTREVLLSAVRAQVATPAHSVEAAPDLLTYGALRRALDALGNDVGDIELLQVSVLLDAHFRQAAAAAFERMTQVRNVLEAQSAGSSASFMAELRGVLGDLTLGPHGYATSLAGRDPVAVWRGVRGLADRLEGLGLRWFINSGTLLGAIRESRLIAHDDDVDLAVILDASNAEEAAAAWVALKGRLAEAKLLNVAFDLEVRSHAKIGQAGGASVDLFPAWIEDGRVFVWPYAAGEAPVASLLPLQQLSIGGVEVQVPNEPAALLTLNYGECWVRPDPSFRFDWKNAGSRFKHFLGALREQTPNATS